MADDLGGAQAAERAAGRAASGRGSGRTGNRRRRGRRRRLCRRHDRPARPRHRAPRSGHPPLAEHDAAVRAAGQRRDLDMAAHRGGGRAKSSVSYSEQISASLANRMSTSPITSSRNAARWRPTQNGSDRLSATCRPARCAIRGGAAERLLRARRVEQIAFEIGDLRRLDQPGVDVLGAEFDAGAEIGRHRALPVRRHQDQAARGAGPARRRAACRTACRSR